MNTESRPAAFPLSLTLLFVVCIALAAGAAIALVVAMIELTRSTRDVEHTLGVQQALETLQLTLVNAETGQRGFLLTNQPHFLEPYIDAVAKQAYYLGTLERLTTGDAEQQQALVQLKPLVSNALQQISETLKTARPDAPPEVVRDALVRGKDRMDEVRFALQLMREREDRKLTDRQAEAERRGRYGALFMLLSNGASLLGLTVLYVAMRGYHRRRHDIEQSVRASEHQYRELFDNAEVGQAECELGSGRMLRGNRKLARMLGYTVDELTRQSLIDLLPRANRLDNARAYRDLAEGRRDALALQQPLRRQDGSTFLASVQVTLTRSAAGEPLRAIAVIEDVTAQTTSARALNDATALLDAVANAAAEPTSVKDVDGRYLFVNRAMEHLLGKPAQAILGQRDVELLDDDLEADDLRSSDLGVIRTGRPQSLDQILTVAGETRTFNVTTLPYRDPTGEIAGVVSVFRDPRGDSDPTV